MLTMVLWSLSFVLLLQVTTTYSLSDSSVGDITTLHKTEISTNWPWSAWKAAKSNLTSTTLFQTQPSVSGCKTIAQYEADSHSQGDWNLFKRHLEDYAGFHHSQLQKLKSGDHTVRTLTWSCFKPVSCCGIGDQLYNIQQALVYAMVSQRVLSLYWNPTSYRTMKYLQPNKIDWTYFNESLGMKKSHSSDQYRGKIRTVEYYDPFYTMLLSEEHHHLTVNHKLQVPFIRGIRLAMTSQVINKTLAQFGITAKLMDNSTGVPLEVLSGELLRYLFHFERSVVDKVERIEQQLGLSGLSYLALHIRTGFLGMEQDEGLRFNSRKAFRNSTIWKKTISCSIKTADKLFGAECPIYLATDSDLVKQVATNLHGQRIRTVDHTLQHVALTKPTKYKKHASSQNVKFTEEGRGDGKDVNGYLATWVDFLLMARARALVHSISGFSVTAGQFCSMCRQYLVPYCTQQTKRQLK